MESDIAKNSAFRCAVSLSKEGRNSRKGRKTGDRDGLRVHEDLFLPFLPFLLSFNDVAVEHSIAFPR